MLHIKLNIQRIKYCMSHINLHIPYLKLSIYMYMTCKITHILDGFRHDANIFGLNMNEY